MATRRYTPMWRNAISKAAEGWRNERLQELKAAFLIGSNVADACKYAQIAESSYYGWIKKYPKLLEEIERARVDPIIVAQRTLTAGLARDPKLAFEYLKLKRPDDWAASSHRVEIATLSETPDRQPDVREKVANAVSEALRKMNQEANSE